MKLERGGSNAAPPLEDLDVTKEQQIRNAIADGIVALDLVIERLQINQLDDEEKFYVKACEDSKQSLRAAWRLMK